MIHLPWVLFLIGNIGYQFYKYNPIFWFVKTKNMIDDDIVMLLSVYLSFVGFISSVIIYGNW